MQKKFLTNLGLLLFLNLLIKPFWVLGIDRSVQNAVGAEDFGFYFSILNFSFLFNILLDMGITNFNNRNIAQNSHLLNKHFSSILILKLLLLAVYVLFTFAVGLIIGYDLNQFKMLGWIAVNQFLLSFVLYLRSNISGLLMFKTESFLSVLDRLLMIFFCSVLLWGNITESKFRIEWFIYAQTGAYVITAITALLIVMSKASFKRLSWNRPFLILILKKSIPFALLVFLMAQYNRIDTVIIERLLPDKTGDHQSGIYAQAFRLLDAANMIAYLFAVLLLPLFARMIKLKLSVENLVKTSFSLLFAISAVVALGSYFYSTELMNWLYPKHIAESVIEFNTRITESARVFSLLMFGFIAISTTYIFGTLLTANGSLKKLNIVAGTGVIISLTINLLLVPRLMAVGSAYASLCAQFITAIAQLIIAVKIFKFRMNYKYLGILLIFLSGLILAGYFSKLLPYDWKINFSVMLVVSILLTFILRLINIKELIRVLRSEQA
jgi:O-antigen/teichoic acid export membrane protein